jgi:SAM-dependent methyltransferase
MMVHPCRGTGGAAILPILPGVPPPGGPDWKAGIDQGHKRMGDQPGGGNLMGRASGDGRRWGAAAQDWAELQEPLALPLWEAMLAAAAVGPGTRLLDARCGAGGASVLAASRGAQVNGCDAAEALLTIARQRVPDSDFRVAALERLPYAEGAFDAIIVPSALAAAVDHWPP